MVDVLRSELAHQSQQQQAASSSAHSPVNRSSISSRRSMSNRNSLGSFQAQLQKSNNGGGVVHTAWYPTQQKSGLFGRREDADNTNASNGKGTAAKKRGTAAAAVTAVNSKVVGGSSKQSYVTALSARGPREDLDIPQIRLTLTVTPVTAASLVGREGPSSPTRVANNGK